MQQAAWQALPELQLPRHIPSRLSTGMVAPAEPCLTADSGKQHIG